MSMISNAVSGLTASLTALQTVSNNSANAMVPGYSQQQVILSSSVSDEKGYGVRVDGIRRISDQYQVIHKREATTSSNYAKIKAQYTGEAEKIYSTAGTNIANGIDKFISAASASMEKPSEQAYRQAIINESKSLAQRFNSVASGLNQQQLEINGQIVGTTKKINCLLSNITQYNTEALTQSVANPSLQDRRDNALNELASLIKIKVTEHPNGSIDVSLDKGQPLLIGTQKASFVIENGKAEPIVKFGNSKFFLDNSAGGTLGGLLSYSQHDLKNNITFINELAGHFCGEINKVLKQGTDLSGKNVNEDLFVFDPKKPASTLVVNHNIKPNMLAFGKNGKQGDNENLKNIIDVANIQFTFTSLGKTKIKPSDAFIGKIGELGTNAQEAKIHLATAKELEKESVQLWASTSGVNMDEQAVNLIVYQQSYQANAKIISAADKLFQSILSSF